MILCFDIGNTNIVLGIVENKKIINTYRFVTNASLTEDEYFHKLQSIVKNLQIEGVVISSVVPSLDLIFVQMIKKYFNINPMIIGPGIKSGLKLRIEAPKTLGSDLLCDAVGAVNKFGGPVIIVDLGTATKFIVVNDKEEYLGGAIAPGMNGSLNSLIQNAAKLSHTALAKPDNVIGNDTTTCIQSGMIYGTASMIDGMVNKTIEELNLPNVKVVLTGGLAPVIKDVLTIDYIYEPLILIEGLIYLYYKNAK
ncbi:MAG: type III pantothenate kinase [Erysipelotrichaceae bacterium]|nr:type III pantothenate kinase [Erysipelotrichaceae bacterium]